MKTTMSRSLRAGGVLSLSLLALTACTEVPTTAEPIATGANLSADGWVPAAKRAAREQTPVDTTAVHGSELSDDELARRALADTSWRADDGRRFDALFVAGDGTSYGRFGEAREVAAPTDTDRGAFNPDDDTIFERTLFKILGGTLSSDRRTLISAASTLESYPYRTVGSLSGDGSTMTGGCTGTMVGPRHVITAAHCVMSSSGSVSTSGYFNPGQTNATRLNGGATRHWSGVMLRDWRVARRFDYALLYLDDSAANAQLGWMGVAWWNDSSGYLGKTAYNKGYPCGPSNSCGVVANQQCKASPRPDKRCDGWMYADDAILDTNAFTSDSRLDYAIDTSEGHSGSAVYTYVDGVPAILAIHYGPDGSYNAGARFRSSMWNDICTWIANVPSAYGTHTLCH